MSSGLNEGFANLLVVQAESGFLGSLSGSAYALPGKVSYSYQPMHGGSIGSRSVWRTSDGDGYAARWFQGSLEIEYTHTEGFALLLASILQRTGSTPNYIFRHSHLSDRQSLAISLSYQPNNQHVVMRGVVVEMFQITMRMRELIKCRIEFKAARMDTAGAIAATVTETETPIAGYIAVAQYASVDMPRANEGTAQIANRIEFTNFGEDAIPTGYEPTGGLEIGLDVGEWLSEDAAEGDAIAADVRNMAEVQQRLSFVPAAGKLFQLNSPRNIQRSGTPPGFQTGGIGYRAGSEAQIAEASANWPVLTLTL